MAQKSKNSVEKYYISPKCSQREFLAASKLYARDVVTEHGLNVDFKQIEWKVSKRAKKRAGAIKYNEDGPKAIILTWDFFVDKGWKEITSTIRHELIHAHLLNEKGDHTHGEEFSRLAEELDTTVNCDMFADPKWWVECSKCQTKSPRYRKSKLITNPEDYQCGGCGGELKVKKAGTDEGE